jgi:imidazolonepropionase
MIASPVWDAAWINGPVATMASRSFGLIDDGVVAVSGGRIAFVGDAANLPGPVARLATRVFDRKGRLLTPGLVDPHTHLVHAGSRWREFEMRSRGATAEELRDAGSGLLATVDATRRADWPELMAASRARALRLLRSGVTTIESKSGYGLDLPTELQLLRVNRQLGRELPLTVVSTFLGAHALPPEYAGRPDEYVDFLVTRVMPAAAREALVDHVDAFCDARGFTHAQVERLMHAAATLGLGRHLHADQYSDFGAGALAARVGALSAAHLEHASGESVRAMARTGTVATLLPGTALVSHSPARPPVEAMRKHGVAMALATNCNPGSSPSTSPSAIMNLACHLLGLSAYEAVAGFTSVAARALGLDAERGCVETGKRADLAIWDAAHPAELAYYVGGCACASVINAGAVAFDVDEPVCMPLAPPLAINS